MIGNLAIFKAHPEVRLNIRRYDDRDLTAGEPVSILRPEIFSVLAKDIHAICMQLNRPLENDLDETAIEIEEFFERIMLTSFRCNFCSAHTWETQPMVKHYRDHHPDKAFDLYDAIGTVGNDFADAALSTLESRGLERNKDELPIVELFLQYGDSARSARRRGKDQLRQAMRKFRARYIYDPIGCFLLFGTIGDDFADSAIGGYLRKLNFKGTPSHAARENDAQVRVAAVAG